MLLADWLRGIRRQSRPGQDLVVDMAYAKKKERAHQHAEERDDSLLRRVFLKVTLSDTLPSCQKRKKESKYSIQLANIPPLRKMRTQTRLGTARSHTTQRPQHARTADNSYTRRPRRHQRRDTVEHHGHVIKHIRREPEHLALGLECAADAVREHYCREAAGYVLQDLEEEG